MSTFDFVIVGGGTAGLVLASRLSSALPDVSILLLEAGPGGDDPRIAKSGGYHVGMDSDLEWDHYTVPQKGINGKVVPQVQGKLLGGASAINQQGWTRGPSVDLNQWAEMVSDKRWSWAGMLPYFKKSETFYPTDEMNSVEVSKNHGFDGPIKVSHAIGSGLPRKYPLRDMTAKAYESVGVHRNQDLNSGDVLGYAEGASSNFEGKRQYATAYPLLNNVTTWTRSLATKLLLENGKVTGVEIQKRSAVGEPEQLSIIAKREVILTSGVQGSPKLLLLSGIGPAEELRKHGIPQVCDLPVGENYSDHPFFYTMWKLRDRGLCLGDGPLVTPDCDWTAGFPGDWMAFHRHEDIIDKFGPNAVDESKLKLLLAEGKPHAESFSVYGHIDLSRTGTPHPGGSAMVLGTLVVSPTSRGTLKLRSANPLDAPLLDPNLLSNELDRQMLYSTGRLMMASMHGPVGQQWGVEEYGIEESIRHDTSDAAMEARMMKTFRTLNHGGGTCAMGSVVDSSCRVIGVEGLRVVDASIFPMPMGCHYQAIVYAIAEQMADLVVAEQK